MLCTNGQLSFGVILVGRVVENVSYSERENLTKPDISTQIIKARAGMDEKSRRFRNIFQEISAL
jgi:hypothetical protein